MSQKSTNTGEIHPADAQDRGGDQPSSPAGDSSPDESLDLSNRQIKALPYLVSSATVTEGIKLAGISRTTFYRWMEDEAFRAEFENLRADIQSYAYAELRGLTLKGALVLAQMLEDESPAIRLKAAQTALSTGMKLTEVADLQEKMANLEDAYTAHKSKKTIL